MVRIGCDIGGVVKELTSQNQIPNALNSLNKLLESNEIIFISKCRDNYMQLTKQWLEINSLDKIPIYFCDTYSGKIEIARREKISVMIDDKLQVLSTFPESIIKIWLCDDQKKITGAKKYQQDLLKSVKLVNCWDDIVTIIMNL